MERIVLGNSDLEITRVGLGAWAIGGPWKWGWGHQSEKDSIATIHRALDTGINWIDTAPVYGLGNSERVVGKAIRGVNKRPFIFTKCSLVWDEQGEVRDSLTASSVRREVETSLKRLGVDVIDLIQVHWPRPDDEIEEGWETLAALQKEGKVRYLGVSNFSVEQMDRARSIAPLTSLQPPFSLLNPSIAGEILPYCEKHGIGTLAYSTMGSGLLTGKMTRDHIANLPDDDWRKGSSRFQEPRLSHALKIVDELRDIANRFDVSPGAVAVQWSLSQAGISAAIVGMRRPDQVDIAGDIHAVTLSSDDLDRLAALAQESLRD